MVPLSCRLLRRGTCALPLHPWPPLLVAPSRAAHASHSCWSQRRFQASSSGGGSGGPARGAPAERAAGEEELPFTNPYAKLVSPERATIGGETEESEQPKRELTPEEQERSKDEAALGLIAKLGACGVLSVVVLYFASDYARRKYYGSEGSTKVNVETRGRPSLGGPFSLVTTRGDPVSQAEFLGQWTFFYFGFTHCPEICPVELNRMTKVVDAVRAARPDEKMVPLFVSCDPRRDSLEAIEEYLSVFHPDFIGLVGTPAQVDEACKSYRIYYSVPDDQAMQEDDYLIDHSIAIFLFDPQGRFVDFFGNRYDEKEITAKVLGYMDNLKRDPTWTNW